MCWLGPPNAFRRAMSANAGGTMARLAALGHLSHGASQTAIPVATATA
jgi:hypothetical protein